MNNNDFEELEILIKYMKAKYNQISNKWIKNDKYKLLNMKTLKVEDLYRNPSLLSYVINYRNFINDHAYLLTLGLLTLNAKNIIVSRVKALNSIQYKIENYENRKEKGKIPIKKCLNDLFGVRMIFENDINFEEINNYLKINFPELKCINSIRGEYQAVHIYFGNDDNKKFQWELQLWDLKHTKSNYASHAKYKQGYTKWENQS